MLKIIISNKVIKYDKNYPIYLSYLDSFVFDYKNKQEKYQQYFNYYTLKNYALTKLENWNHEQFLIMKAPNIAGYLKKDLISEKMKILYFIWTKNENLKNKYYEKLNKYELLH